MSDLHRFFKNLCMAQNDFHEKMDSLQIDFPVKVTCGLMESETLKVNCQTSTLFKTGKMSLFLPSDTQIKVKGYRCKPDMRLYK